MVTHTHTQSGKNTRDKVLGGGMRMRRMEGSGGGAEGARGGWVRGETRHGVQREQKTQKKKTLATCIVSGKLSVRNNSGNDTVPAHSPGHVFAAPDPPPLPSSPPLPDPLSELDAAHLLQHAQTRTVTASKLPRPHTTRAHKHAQQVAVHTGGGGRGGGRQICDDSSVCESQGTNKNGVTFSA